jgi:hypothetical protein
MVARSLILRLTDIVEAIERINGVLENLSLDAFETDWQRQWLVQRGVEIISEASRHLTDEVDPWSSAPSSAAGNRAHEALSRRGSLTSQESSVKNASIRPGLVRCRPITLAGRRLHSRAGTVIETRGYRSLSGLKMPNLYRTYALTRLPKIVRHLQTKPGLWI